MKAKVQPVEEDDVSSDVLSFDTLDEVLGFHVRQAQGTMHRRIIEVLAEVDLTQKQAATLWLVGANPGVSQTGIGNALRMDRATTMAIIDRLENRGVVIRRRSTVDRRRHELYLTPEGQTLLVKVKKVVKAHEADFARRFTEQELATLIDLLRRIYG
jgi:DNA-binding MarR family transcriptional regulator